MKLVPVDPKDETHLKALYLLLEERPIEASISHQEMPTWEDHVRFVERTVPHRIEEGEMLHRYSYEDWCLIDCEGQCAGPKRYGDVVGCVYLTRANEIGVSVFRDYQRLGIGPHAVRLLMEKHGRRRYLANCNPANEPSRKMFEKLGFKLLQVTYALEAE